MGSWIGKGEEILFLVGSTFSMNTSKIRRHVGHAKESQPIPEFKKVAAPAIAVSTATSSGGAGDVTESWESSFPSQLIESKYNTRSLIHSVEENKDKAKARDPDEKKKWKRWGFLCWPFHKTGQALGFGAYSLRPTKRRSMQIIDFPISHNGINFTTHK